MRERFSTNKRRLAGLAVFAVLAAAGGALSLQLSESLRSCSADNSLPNVQNAFLGCGAGSSNVAGSENAFFGHNAGRANTDGSENVFIGQASGAANTTGGSNVFVGENAGEANTTGERNTFIGSDAGEENTTGGRNIFIGYNAGRNNTEGSGNIFIGNEARAGNIAESLKLNIGGLITGDLAEASRRVNIQGALNCLGSVCGASSKIYKRNIEIYNDYERLLEDVLQTALFRFKRIDEHPEKIRIGLIAENLPSRLQLPEKPLKPDWPSVYGTLWGGIKALADRLSRLKEEFSQELKLVKSRALSADRRLLQAEQRATETRALLEQALQRLEQMEKRMKKDPAGKPSLADKQE